MRRCRVSAISCKISANGLWLIRRGWLNCRRWNAPPRTDTHGLPREC
jgi:hypothetical protein